MGNQQETQKERNKAVSTVALMMLATAVSKLLGMVRGMLMASHYGTGLEANAFTAASRIPMSFMDLLFSAAIVGCFVPVYNSFGREREREADRFAALFLNVIWLLTGLLALLGILFARPLIALVAGGLSPETQALAVTLLRILFPMVIFIGGAYTLVGVMQSKDRFLLPALISSVSNAGVILYFLFLDRSLGERSVYGLCIAYLIAWFIQFITLAVPLGRDGFRFFVKIRFSDPDLRRALRMVPPIMIGSWLLPVSVITGTHFSSLVAVDGNVTVFDYAYNVFLILAGILTYSICNYVFPSLSRMAAAGEGDSFVGTFRRGLLSSFLIMLPFTFGALVLSGEGISVLYQRGVFDAAAAAYTAQALRYAVLGMPGFAVIEYMSRVFFSRQRPTLPMIAALIGVAVNVAVSAGLVRYPSLGIGAVTAGLAAGETAAAVVLMLCAVREIPGSLDRSFWFEMLKLFLSASFSYFIMRILYRMIGNNPFDSPLWRDFGVMAAVFVPALVMYLVFLKLFRFSLFEAEKN